MLLLSPFTFVPDDRYLGKPLALYFIVSLFDGKRTVHLYIWGMLVCSGVVYLSFARLLIPSLLIRSFEQCEGAGGNSASLPPSHTAKHKLAQARKAAMELQSRERRTAETDSRRRQWAAGGGQRAAVTMVGSR